MTIVRHGVAAASAMLCLLLTVSAALPEDVCQSEECWSMSTTLHAWLNTSASPCVDFEAFLCDGFRSSHQFTGDSLTNGIAYLDYMHQIGAAYSERVTEQLATGCWGEADCQDPWRPVSPKLREYERVAYDALRYCARLQTALNQSLHDLVILNLNEVLEEAIDFGTAGIEVGSQVNLRFESLLPAQSAKSLLSPLIALANVARRHGRPAIMLVATEPFLGLQSVSRLFTLFPMQASRLLRRLQIPLPRGLTRLMWGAQANLLLWDIACNSTVERVAKAHMQRPVHTVADAKRMLRAANLTFDLDEFLRLSVSPWNMTVSDSTDLLAPDPHTFLHTVCMLEKSAKTLPDLAKVLVMHQITMLALEVLKTPKDASCVGEFFGIGVGGRHNGAFRPLLHGRYARARPSPTVEAETRDIFARLKATYISALTAKKWVPAKMKRTLAQQLQKIELTLQNNLLTEENLLRHYRGVMDSMPATGCSLSVSPACLLVRTTAFRMSVLLRLSLDSLDSVSPHYTPFHHAVHLTPAFSDPPQYRPGQPLAVRLGLIGVTLVHELTHGLMVEPEPIDQMNLKLKKATAQLPGNWAADFAERFRARETCLRDRLAARQGLNKTSVAEDVADLVGLSVAFKMLNQSGDTQRLPGYMARFSPAQLFYIASLRTFCSKGVPNFWRVFLSVSSEISHTPGKMRIQSMIAGDANFAPVFGCPRTAAAGSREERECDFW